MFRCPPQLHPSTVTFFFFFLMRSPFSGTLSTIERLLLPFFCTSVSSFANWDNHTCLARSLGPPCRISKNADANEPLNQGGISALKSRLVKDSTLRRFHLKKGPVSFSEDTSISNPGASQASMDCEKATYHSPSVLLAPESARTDGKRAWQPICLFRGMHAQFDS